jgi:hypothetical protein
MSVEIAWKQNILVTDFHLLKSLLVVFGFGSQAFICGFSRQNINSVVTWWILKGSQYCLHTFSMALYHKCDIKNGFNYMLQTFSLIFDSLDGVGFMIAKLTSAQFSPELLN